MKNTHILLVEDDVFVSKAYAYFLRKAGFNVTTANDGETALTTLTKIKPDIILLDLIMPIMNGFEVLEQLKKKKISKEIPVIIVSNLAQDSEREECLRLGATDYLIKSDFLMKDVIEKVKKYIEPTTSKS
jgi:DNA-binding response OmpR family regulator